MIVLVRCSDPRINRAVDELLGAEGEYSIIANTGSIKYFLARDKLSDLVDQINILAKGFGADKIVLTNHTDCGFYKRLGQDGETYYVSDLQDTKKFLSRAFPKMVIECYLINTKTSKLKFIA